MGQINEAVKDERYSKVCGEELKRALDEGDSEAMKRWMKHTSKTFRDLREQWNAVRQAIDNLENWGRYRAMMELAIKQVEVAQDIKTKCMQTDSMEGESFVSINTTLADSYLSLARSNFRLSEFTKCIDYCAKSFSFVGKCRGASNEMTSRIAGEIHLCRGRAQLRLGNYRKALEDLERALSLATSQQNADLECMSCCALGRLYLNLKDFEKATFFPLKASETLSRKDSPSNRTVIQLQLSEAYRKVGKLEAAMGSSEEAMKFALETGDRGSQAHCLLSFADIHRAKRDSEKAIPRYESAISMMRQIGDRYGEVRTLVGKAKMHLKNKMYHEAVKDYQNAMKIAEQIQAKTECLAMHGELALTFQRMNRVQEARDCLTLYHKLLEDMDLYCGACKKPISEKNQQLESLPCAHIFHLQCVSERGFVNTRACPSCRKLMTKPPS